MERNEDQLPEDVRGIAARLTAARVTPSALELDELRGRVHHRLRRGEPTPRRGLGAVLRVHGVAVLLATGLILTSGVGVVLASGSFGGGDKQTYGDTDFHGHDKHASSCQYDNEWSGDYSWQTQHSTMHVYVDWDCDDYTIHVHCGDEYQYKFGNKGWNDVKETSYTTTAPSGTSGLTLKTGGQSHSISFGG
ncbi:MAG TPA: hypothetical protein VKS25_07645 [Solirubrobacteraceae bacterium]|nr:hypothetical protein [Solirubrobacteraceae bacterium]